MPTSADVVAALAARSDPAVCWPGGRSSGADLAARSRASATSLHARGVGPGDVVAVLTGPNRVEGLVARYAAQLAGAAVVHLGTSSPISDRVRLGADARLAILETTSARVLLADEESRAEALELAARNGRVEVLAASRSTPGERAVATDLPPGRPGDLASVDLTSGTTGAPRLVRRSVGAHGRLVQHLAASRTAERRFLAVTPISRTTASIVDATLLRGGSVVLHDEFEADRALDAIGHLAVTDTYLTVPQLVTLLEHPDLPETDLSRLRQVVYSGSATPPRRAAQAAGAFGAALVQLYGSTELGGICALEAPDHREPALLPTVGAPFPWVRLQVRRPGTPELCAPHEAGEVWVSSDTAMTGYWGEPDHAGSAEPGWLPSGDLGRLDRLGYLRLTGRVERVIKRRGVKLYPAAIEEALAGHPDVRGAQVRVRVDPERGEHVQAVIDLRPGRRCSEAQLRSHVAERLTEEHAPTEITFWSGLPLTPSGQPDYSHLRARARG